MKTPQPRRLRLESGVSANGLTSSSKTCTLSLTLCPSGSVMWLHAGQRGAGGQRKWPQKSYSRRDLVLSVELKGSDKVFYELWGQWYIALYHQRTIVNSNAPVRLSEVIFADPHFWFSTLLESGAEHEMYFSPHRIHQLQRAFQVHLDCSQLTEMNHITEVEAYYSCRLV